MPNRISSRAASSGVREPPPREIDENGRVHGPFHPRLPTVAVPDLAILGAVHHPQIHEREPGRTIDVHSEEEIRMRAVERQVSLDALNRTSVSSAESTRCCDVTRVTPAASSDSSNSSSSKSKRPFWSSTNPSDNRLTETPRRSVANAPSTK